MRKLQIRSFVLLIFLYIALTLLVNITIGRSIGNANMKQQEDALISQLRTLTSQVNYELENVSEIVQIVPVLRKADSAIEERIVLVNYEGQVYYDSQDVFKHLDNLSRFPEFSGVLSGEGTETDIREGENTEQNLYHVAEPIYSSEGEVIGGLRISKPVRELQEASRLMQTYLLVFGISAMLVAAFTMFYWLDSIAKPIKEIKDVAIDVSNNNFSSRYRGHSYEEIDELGETINTLALNIESYMDELEQSNEKLQYLMDNLIVGVMLLDNNRNIQVVNPKLIQMIGQDLSSSLGRSYIHFLRNPWIVKMIEDAYSSLEVQSDEIIILEGDELIFDATVIPIQLGEQEETSFIVLFYDITEIRRLEKVRTDFVANASHELRTPVTALKGFAETLLAGAKDDPEKLVEFLEIIDAEAERLDLIVGDILQLSRLEQKDFNVNITDLNVRDVVEHVFKILNQKAETKSIELKLDAKNEVYMEYDINILKQILINLINNAILYTQVNGEITVHIDTDGRNAKISVEDNGIGIPASEQSRVFERFYRIDKARSRNAGGTGLGLSIVKHMVESTHGSIQLESSYGIGSTFIVNLPLKQPDELY